MWAQRAAPSLAFQECQRAAPPTVWLTVQLQQQLAPRQGGQLVVHQLVEKFLQRFFWGWFLHGFDSRDGASNN
jgi:hypothetical protein